MTTREASKEFCISIRRVQQICKANRCGTPPGEGRRDWDVDKDKFEKALNKNGREAGRPKDDKND